MSEAVVGCAKSYINPEHLTLTIGASEEVLNHNNPKNWDDDPELDELTKQTLSAMIRPKVYMHLYYKTHTFGQLTESLHGRWQDVDYLIMDGSGIVRLGITPDEKQTGRKLNYGAKQLISQFVTTVNINILNGDYGKLSNLTSARIILKASDLRVLQGFIPCFHFPFEDYNNHISQIFVYFTSKLTILQFHNSQCDNAFQYIQTTAALKKFDKMCAWCGNEKRDRLLKCKCKTSRYCTKDCQTMHWPFHKNICKEVMADMRSIPLE
jgi:hypothetical protein